MNTPPPSAVLDLPKTLEPGSLIRVRRCIDCGNEFAGLLGICSDCSEERLRCEQEAAARAREIRRDGIWHAMCPLAYQNTDWNHAGLSPACRKLAEEWTPGKCPAGITDYNPGSSGMSLGMFGSTGCGKTRAAFAILRRHFEAGWSVFAVHASDAWDLGSEVQGLSSAVRLQYDDNPAVKMAAVQCLRRIREAHLLLIDDMGKERANGHGIVTEAVGEAIYSLMEHRVANKLPTIWTCNMGAADLEQRLGQDRGAPTVRRLRDVSCLPEIL